MLTNLLADFARELIINSVTGTGGNDTALDWLANQSHVANDVKQLVTGSLVLPLQGLVLDVTQVGGIAMLNVEHVSQHVKALLSGLAFVDNDGVV